MKRPSNRWTFASLASEVEMQGLRISWEAMEPGFSGAVDLVSGTVFLDRQLDSQPRYALSVLAHELGHYSLGHTCAQSRNGEALADEWAARLLIHPDEYRHAEHAYGANLYWLSFELGVSQRIVKAFQTTLAA